MHFLFCFAGRGVQGRRRGHIRLPPQRWDIVSLSTLSPPLLSSPTPPYLAQLHYTSLYKVSFFFFTFGARAAWASHHQNKLNCTHPKVEYSGGVEIGKLKVASNLWVKGLYNRMKATYLWPTSHGLSIYPHHQSTICIDSFTSLSAERHIPFFFFFGLMELGSLDIDKSNSVCR